MESYNIWFYKSKEKLYLISRFYANILIAILYWKLLRMRPPYFNFIQPIKYNNPLQKTQKFQPIFDNSSGSRNMNKLMLEITAHAQTPLQFYLANKEKPQSTTPFRKPKTLNRFLISLTVHEIWTILCWKLLRMQNPHLNFIQPICRSLQV